MADLTPSLATKGISIALAALVVSFLLADAGVSLFAPHLLAEGARGV